MLDIALQAGDPTTAGPYATNALVVKDTLIQAAEELVPQFYDRISKVSYSMSSQPKKKQN